MTACSLSDARVFNQIMKMDSDELECLSLMMFPTYRACLVTEIMSELCNQMKHPSLVDCGTYFQYTPSFSYSMLTEYS